MSHGVCSLEELLEEIMMPRLDAECEIIFGSFVQWVSRTVCIHRRAKDHQVRCCP